MERDSILAALISFGVSAVLGPVVIPFLRRLKFGQTERKEGVAAHLKKAGTPTMGGVIILAGVLAASFYLIPGYTETVPVLILMFGFGIIGFLDDYLKVVLRRSDGLIAWQKLLLQVFFTTIFLLYLTKSTELSLKMRLPFTNGAMADLGFLAYPLLYFAVIGTVNGVNFTDGLDGLASTVTLVMAVFYTAVSWFIGGGGAPVSSAVGGALLGFLLYNAYPAKIFMGDTGSLALGGFVAGMAYVTQTPLFILIAGIIYLIEVLSVIIQVVYFKATKGKRIFRMAPIHHHFELGGWSETKIVAVFSIVTAVMCLISLLAI